MFIQVAKSGINNAAELYRNNAPIVIVPTGLNFHRFAATRKDTRRVALVLSTRESGGYANCGSYDFDELLIRSTIQGFFAATQLEQTDLSSDEIDDYFRKMEDQRTSK